MHRRLVASADVAYWMIKTMMCCFCAMVLAGCRGAAFSPQEVACNASTAIGRVLLANTSGVAVPRQFFFPEREWFPDSHGSPIYLEWIVSVCGLVPATTVPSGNPTRSPCPAPYLVAAWDTNSRCVAMWDVVERANTSTASLNLTVASSNTTGYVHLDGVDRLHISLVGTCAMGVPTGSQPIGHTIPGASRDSMALTAAGDGFCKTNGEGNNGSRADGDDGKTIAIVIIVVVSAAVFALIVGIFFVAKRITIARASTNLVKQV